jgi:hypothetical protein
VFFVNHQMRMLQVVPVGESETSTPSVARSARI